MSIPKTMNVSSLVCLHSFSQTKIIGCFYETYFGGVSLKSLFCSATKPQTSIEFERKLSSIWVEPIFGTC